MSDYPAINKTYESFFKDVYPARTCVAVKGLPLNGLLNYE